MSNPYVNLLKTSYKYARSHRKKFILVYAMFIGANLVSSMNPLLYGWFIGKAQKDSSHVFHYALVFVGCYLLLKLTEWSLHGPARIMERTTAFHLSRNFIQEKYHQTLHLTTKWHQDHHSGATINRIKRAYDALRSFSDRGFMFLYTFTKFVFSVCAILYFSPFFGSIAITLGLCTIWIITKFNKPFIKTLKEVNECENKVTANLFDSLSNIRTVITLRLEKSMESGLLEKIHQIYHPFRKNAKINEWKWFVADIMVTIIYCTVVAGYVYQHWEAGKVFYIAGLVTLLGYVNQFTSVFQGVAGQFTDIMQLNTNISAADSISEDFARQHRSDCFKALPDRWQKLEIHHLNYSHQAVYDHQSSNHCLHDLHLRINRGQKIALIGESGSGKSTLLSLLRGLYLPEKEARLLVDDRQYAFDSLQGAITLFPQEPEIFENTIAYNVTLGLPFSEEEVWKVCRLAQFSEVIRQMPEGLDTNICEKGVNLSGGQKQRLALARGILAARDSQVLLLDEPTSSVDSKTEALIYKNLFIHYKDKAFVSSIHRLHLLDQFDYIYMLDKGKIVAQGTFDELLQKSKSFQELWEHQRGPAFSAAQSFK
jgi:ATP-binding cassette, subfamily B, bacterial